MREAAGALCSYAQAPDLGLGIHACKRACDPLFRAEGSLCSLLEFCTVFPRRLYTARLSWGEGCPSEYGIPRSLIVR